MGVCKCLIRAPKISPFSRLGSRSFCRKARQISRQKWPNGRLSLSRFLNKLADWTGRTQTFQCLSQEYYESITPVAFEPTEFLEITTVSPWNKHICTVVYPYSITFFRPPQSQCDLCKKICGNPLTKVLQKCYTLTVPESVSEIGRPRRTNHRSCELECLDVKMAAVCRCCGIVTNVFKTSLQPHHRMI